MPKCLTLIAEHENSVRRYVFVVGSGRTIRMESTVAASEKIEPEEG